ncbi:hypothetical protein SEA_LISARA_38 [Arthrobacter phage LiSara]|uniref:Uncharacterized protein n=1 Tax=Arthrobacter phage LiSara TaxID=2015860 RepID=A0A222ZH50_9CAUD|nr:hypothetical protein KMD21_gp38 [Arthrobacter phage LiSara]ASR83622.1 hypothetical protein SEA_LISARA_38 [Arthrobacter phage LiSara]
MLYRAARWWYSPILCGALGSAVSMTARKLGNPVSPSLAAALFVTAICAAISLLLIVLVTRTVKSRRARRAEAAAAERRAAQRIRDEVNGRYPVKREPSNLEKRQSIITALATTAHAASAAMRAEEGAARRDAMQGIADALSTANAPLRRPTPTPAEVRRRAESLAKRTPQRTAYRPSSGYTPHFPSVILTDAPDDSSSRRRDDAVADATLGAAAMVVAMESYTAPSYTPDPSPSYSSPSPSYDSSPSSYDGGGSFGGGDSGSF